MWIDEEPTYGHLWTLEELEAAVRVVAVDERDNVAVFRLEAPT